MWGVKERDLLFEAGKIELVDYINIFVYFSQFWIICEKNVASCMTERPISPLNSYMYYWSGISSRKQRYFKSILAYGGEG